MTEKPSDITISRYRPGDETGIVALIVSIQTLEFGVATSAEKQPDLFDIPNFYQTGAGEFWVARHGADIVGTIAMKDIGGGQAALRKMFVAAAFRGRDHAVAARLLATLVQAARAARMSDIYLGTIDMFHAARRFYEKNGFVEVAPADLPQTFPRMAVDNMFYRLKL
ncbi:MULTISPECIES: GNAT family N-acetyltransferase [unclassified Rhizobium]|uniref:GNAT family N-acetyltransferase n=1 Tax=unclassified Rhizobium TaxID=2613769 RepID=UPI00071572A2|nr:MULTISPECIES: GNAT family N-acetyltransferase [unclassified Rhizobium]KQS88320.1 GNAT family acetyltransferase [Rhizobium sp. Leaf391]KQT03911.1 GNAT family acetyltransferase [Rhizobium sp. Leaf386]KQT95627.1 GNAT family acetyltransferase [Rhizobium sp. Leaf453]